MKKVFIIVALLLCCIPSFSQDTLQYDYAIMIVRSEDEKMEVRYSNGKDENLIPKLKLKSHMFADERFENIFKCIAYLNQNGYELVTSTSSTGCGEYTFKRKRLVK